VALDNVDEPRIRESPTGIRVLIVASDVEIVFDERSADVRVLTDAFAMDDGIEQRKRAQEKDHQNSCLATRMVHRGPWACV
jgi:hypothetical protein